MWPNKCVFEGQFEEDEPHGRGVYRYRDGSSYEGELVYGLRHGHGLLTYSNGDVYEGGFENGKRHGQGTERLATGEVTHVRARRPRAYNRSSARRLTTR